MFKIKSEKPLSSKCLTKYSGIAYDGCWVYMTVHCECKILRFDKCFKSEKCFDTYRCYASICYDVKENCFWASSDSFPSVVYKLNQCFEEIDSICIKIPLFYDKIIKSISYNCCKDELLVAVSSGVLSLNKSCPEKSTVLLKTPSERTLSVLSVCPYYVCSVLSGSEKLVRIYSCSKGLIKEYKIPYEIEIESSVFYPCSKNCSCCKFLSLVTKKHSYPYIFECVFDDKICDNICGCNYRICDRICPEPEPCHDKKPCCDVLESIALIETSIAHILNAEGEKLQKVLATTDDTEKILRVNKSINSTIVKATNLEQVLFCKLEALNECCDFCGEDCCDCDCSSGCENGCKSDCDK
ncbi:MAG: hypothetical protein RR540_00765 [Oscillospiraceae bacterium]